MTVYELTHLSYCCDDILTDGRKKLGIFLSYEDARQAISAYTLSPGFCDNPAGFVVRQRDVPDCFEATTVFEALIYIHSKNYKVESIFELGVFADAEAAQKSVLNFCSDNHVLVDQSNLVVEKIVNHCSIGKREWSEGFTVFDDNI